MSSDEAVAESSPPKCVTLQESTAPQKNQATCDDSDRGSSITAFSKSLGEDVDKLGKGIGSIQLGIGEDMSDEVAGFLSGTELETMTQQRDDWKVQAEENAKIVETLQKRLNTNIRAHPALSADIASRLNSLEQENQQLKSENNKLKERLRETEGENILLSYESTSKSNKLRGANKKVVKEKSVASQEKEKAKTAVHEKNERLKAEKNWRKERNDALAALQEQKKINEQLRAELEVEKSGFPHLREDGTDKDDTTVVIPIEFKIYRGDFIKLQMVFDANQMKTTDQYERWYMQWKKPKEEVPKVIGADYGTSKDTKKIKIGVDLYDDMTELRDEMSGSVYIPATGAEHAGRRSRRSLRNFTRSVQDNYNANNSGGY